MGKGKVYRNLRPLGIRLDFSFSFRAIGFQYITTIALVTQLPHE